MGRRGEEMNMKLVNGDEFDEESLTEASDEESDKVALHKLRVTKRGVSTMGGFMQVVVFIMFWFIMIGVCMLVLHIVARQDPHRQMVIFVGLAGSWIILSNVLALAVFIIDKYHAFNSQPRVSEALVHTIFMLGGVVFGWLGLCVTCYRPPGVKNDRMSGFICRAMIFSAVGLTVVVVLILRVIVPNIEMLKNTLPLP